MSCKTLGFQPEIRKFKLIELDKKMNVVNEWFFGLDWEAEDTKSSYESFAKKIGCSNTFRVVTL